MPKFLHSVKLEQDKCLGCTNCIKRCPTEAIRVRDGKAIIISERCIDCGECIRICPHKAKRALYDTFESISDFKYKIALPAPALFGQFDNLDDIDLVLTGLIEIGFDAVFEVSRAAEIISEVTRRFFAERHKEGRRSGEHPIISTACPAVVRLIAVRFPYLSDYLLPILAPVELAARLARADAKNKHPELSDDDIGVFFITPCPAKVSYIREPIGVDHTAITGALPITDIYLRLISAMPHIKKSQPLSRSGVIGISWATTGGEAAALLDEKYLAADGIENVIRVLDEIENENFSGLDFIELNACSGGCVGGALTMENPYIAKARLQQLRKFLPFSQNTVETDGAGESHIEWSQQIEENRAMRFSDDKKTAIEMRVKMNRIAKSLPGLDCGSCGAPSCRALAEDIVRGEAYESDCIFRMKEKIQEIFRSIADIEHINIDKLQ
ncbi:MAG: 4Fe-4S dicluster domain-containing protein [Clostridia bacterium]|nr:4Fe-4S dicluster domain-containing protein [Clostridia bacterium]